MTKRCPKCESFSDSFSYKYCEKCGSKLILDVNLRVSFKPESLRMPLEEEMNAFSIVCKVAKHGASFGENWNALGYSYPKTGFLSSLFSNEKNEIAKVLYDELLDSIVEIGLKHLDLTATGINDYLESKHKVLADDDLQQCIERLMNSGYYNGEGRLEDRLERNNLSTNDLQRLLGTLKIIKLSYDEVFSEIFKDYDVNLIRKVMCRNCGKDVRRTSSFCPYCGTRVTK